MLLLLPPLLKEQQSCMHPSAIFIMESLLLDVDDMPDFMRLDTIANTGSMAAAAASVTLWCSDWWKNSPPIILEEHPISIIDWEVSFTKKEQALCCCGDEKVDVYSSEDTISYLSHNEFQTGAKHPKKVHDRFRLKFIAFNVSQMVHARIN